ncbi:MULTISPECIES: transcriptional regulator [Enterocloster]|uniref:Predicted transcriptional regulator YheO, contains PAS and DNA-binding HTH domains n=1 Tax=Enterocloster lavalensis TaxID=460384 RepID=A0A1I0GCT4_9FIRM|nr:MULTISPECIES: helix-turn-helix transcriptional regulator [Enterocloster]MDR3756393.1 helix-turn-helix transcriptional regulator [Enterocloster sp.]SET68717.1 Predicted transcriptional regulator YheO, contains PAS and DNA-binding HTH domains [Enterocloster lavalensis]
MHVLLKSLIPIAETIGKTFGNRCEVVLHDLTIPEKSVVYTVNGDVTGRREGQTFDRLVRSVLLNKNFTRDYAVNYTFETEDGRRIKSSSSLVRDEAGEVVGVFCVNYDITFMKTLHDELELFLPMQEDSSVICPEMAADQDVTTVVDTLIDNIVSGRKKQGLTKQDNLEMIRFMDDKGIFLVKGAIDKVAACMGLSKVTIYGYLDTVRGKNGKS